jgi:elongation factor Ts
LAHDLAMQVVAAKPLYLTPEEVPASVVEEEKANYRAEMKDSGKPERILDKIVEGKLKKYYEEICLMEQPFIKDTAITVRELVQQHNALLGENIVVRRFVRYEIGG